MVSMSIKQRRLRDSSRGMVSIIVTLVMMLVISIIVLGFAQVSRYEQRQTLDRQLSSQAFLAAESGVNDVRQLIATLITGGQTIPEKPQCDRGNNVPSNPYYGLSTSLDTSNDISYSCLLVSTQLNSLVQVVPGDGTGVTLALHPVSGQLTQLHIHWSLSPAPASVAGCKTSVPGIPVPGDFPQAGPVSGWGCPYGMLRMDIVPTDTLNRLALMNNQKAVFFYPIQTGVAQWINYANLAGSVTPMECSTTDCSVDVRAMPTGVGGFTDYSIHLTGIYNGGTVTITADGTSGPNTTLKDAQALVDVTGKAQDVLRRIQVRLTLGTNGAPSYALQSGGAICKRFGIGPGIYSIPTDIPGSLQDPTNPMCQPN